MPGIPGHLVLSKTDAPMPDLRVPSPQGIEERFPGLDIVSPPTLKTRESGILQLQPRACPLPFNHHTVCLVAASQSVAVVRRHITRHYSTFRGHGQETRCALFSLSLFDAKHLLPASAGSSGQCGNPGGRLIASDDIGRRARLGWPKANLCEGATQRVPRAVVSFSSLARPDPRQMSFPPELDEIQEAHSFDMMRFRQLPYLTLRDASNKLLALFTIRRLGNSKTSL